MTHPIRGFGLASTLVLIFTLSACSDVVPGVRTNTGPTASSNAAYVYVQIQGPEGSVYGFRASTTGQLSTIPGSPFKPAGEIIGATPTKFFTLGKTLIHSYGIASDGAIGAQLSQMPFGAHDNECSSQPSGSGGAVLDHSGKYIYVDFGCAASDELQTYLIHADGAFSYVGDTDQPTCWDCGVGLPSILGNESFAYAEEDFGWSHQSTTIGFRRESSGTLEPTQITEKDPLLDGNYNYTVQGPDASPTGNYVVFQLYPYDGNPPQLGSYTVDSDGNVATTNTSSNMPTTALDQPSTTFSPSGDFFVAYADGIEIYKFNGAAPLTLRQTVLSGTPIGQVAWDESNHMYAISWQTNMLYVYTVTPSSATLSSSINIGSPFKMVVVSE